MRIARFEQNSRPVLAAPGTFKHYALMKTLSIFTIILCASITWANDTLKGAWRGAGSMLTANANTVLHIELNATIDLNETHLVIIYCTTLGTLQRCYDSQFDIENTYDVLEEGRKIGTAF